jgi:arylsulfatase A-like enzyme
MRPFAILACLAIWPANAPVASAAERPPNVIFILTDDQGWGDAAFAGHPYTRTPSLDRLAAEGTWLRQFYVAATVCSPSRAAFMTSRYPARDLIHGHIATHDQNAARSMPDWLDPQVTTLPRLLKGAGYTTAHFGKWHLGNGPGAPPPEDYGFDTSKTMNSNGPAIGEEGKDEFFRAKSTALIVDETIQFIRENKDRPFFINAWTLLPHAKLHPTPEQLAEYADLSPSSGEPGFGPWMRDYLGKAQNLRSQMQVYCASITDLDTQVGRLMDALDEMGLLENTILFYSSDNGPEDYRITNASNAGVGSTGPLRARKRSMHEGGIRTLGLVRWPGKVPAGRLEESSVTGAVDFLPTICKLAGVPLPDGLQPDGEDVSDIWLGKSRPRGGPLHWEWLFGVQGPDDGYMPPPLAIRHGEWKLFCDHKGGSQELYNIVEDAGEEREIAAAHPEVVRELTEKALAWVETLPPSPARDVLRETGKPGERAPRRAAPAAAPKAGPDRNAAFDRWDKNRDGKLTFEEYSQGLGKPDAPERFKRFDTDGDGILTREEFARAGRPPPAK